MKHHKFNKNQTLHTLVPDKLEKGMIGDLEEKIEKTRRDLRHMEKNLRHVLNELGQPHVRFKKGDIVHQISRDKYYRVLAWKILLFYTDERPVYMIHYSMRHVRKSDLKDNERLRCSVDVKQTDFLQLVRTTQDD